MAEPGEPVLLFAGGNEGFGDALASGRDRYPWAFNFNSLTPGRIAPSLAPTLVSLLTNAPVEFAFEWETTAGVPLILYGSGASADAYRILKIQDNAITQDVLGAAGTGRAADGVLYRDGDTEAAFIAGQTASATRFMVKRIQDGTYSLGDATADRLGVVGAELWRAIDGYKLEQLTADTSPITEANWSGVRIPVGNPSYPINKILDFGGSPLVFKGDGVFRFIAPNFVNLTPHIEPHPDNGKGGTADGRGRYYYPTASGDLLVITFGSQRQEWPTRMTWVDRDTPWGPITAMAADSEYIYAATQPGAKRHNQQGLRVFKELATVFTDYTTQVTDGQWATEADFGDVDTPASDWIYVGADEPFWFVWFDVSTARTQKDVTDWRFEYSTGTSTFSTPTAKIDSTAILFRSGPFVLNPSTDIVAAGSWTVGTVNGVANKYWIRISPLSDALTGVKVREVKVGSYRPGPDPDLNPVALGQAVSGALPHILVGQWQGGDLVWHDVYTVQAPMIEQMVVSRTQAANVTGDRNLWAIHREGAHYVSVGPEAQPARGTYLPTTGVPHYLSFSGNDFGRPFSIKRANQIAIMGEFLQAADELWFYYRWDNEDRWHREGPFEGGKFPVLLNNLQGEGRVLYSGVQMVDTNRSAAQPFVTYAIVTDWEDRGPVWGARGTDFRTPESF